MTLSRSFFFILPLFLPFFNLKSQAQVTDNDYPEHALRYSFKKTGQDSLEKIMDFDLSGSNTKGIGFLSSITFHSNYIYLADIKYSKVYVLNRKTFKHQFTIDSSGEGPVGKLEKPFGLQVLQNKLMVLHGQGPSLATFFTFDGQHCSSIARKHNFNSSMDMSLMLVDSTLYTTLGMAYNHKKVQMMNLHKQDNIREILSISDFYNMADSSNFKRILSSLYLSRSVKYPAKFYAVPGTKPLANIYQMDGKLIKSYDLRTIPILNTYYTQFKQLLLKPFSDRRMSFTYFPRVINDDNDNLIFSCQNVVDMEKIAEDLKGIDDRSNVKNYYVFVNLESKTYKVFKCEFSYMPFKVIDGNLWCFDHSKSRIIVYKLPN